MRLLVYPMMGSSRSSSDAGEGVTWPGPGRGDGLGSCSVSWAKGDDITSCYAAPRYWGAGAGGEVRSDLECPLSEGPDELHALGHQGHTSAHCMVWRRCEYSSTGSLCFSR